MKRDMDLCRRILLAVEDSTSGWNTGESDWGCEKDVLLYNCELLQEAELLWGEKRGRSGEFDVIRLTWAGHEFVDAARDEKRWEEAKGIGDKVKNWTFATLGQVLAALASQSWQQLISG